MMKQFLFLFGFTLWSHFAFSQLNVRDSAIATPYISIQYGFNLTSGDLAETHGNFSHIGFFAGYKTARNWVYGVDASYMFGNDVRTVGLFDHLVDSKGNITDQNGDNAQVFVYSRGLHANVNVGKILPILSPNPNSGIYINAGVGFLAHKIRVETQEQVVPTLELDYRKGYDRLAQGVNFSQFLGYSFMANEGFVKFYAGFYVQEGLTHNKRTVYFDQPDTPVSTDLRYDIQYGMRVGWLIPIYKRKPKDFYFD